MPGYRSIVSKNDGTPVTPSGQPIPCVSCKRDATFFCGTKLSVLRRCGEPLCAECTHFADGRVPIHDRVNADRHGNKFRAEEQAEELLEMGTLIGDSSRVARSSKEPSKREMRRARDDLVQLLGELRDQTVVVDGVPDTSRPGEPDGS